MSIQIGVTEGGAGIGLPLKFANRHGLVSGATGTGKTVTLQRMAEEFSRQGVPVFAADIKGDLSGVSTAFPVEFWDVLGDNGHPIRTSLQEMGAIVLARMLNLNEVQSGTLAIALKRAADNADFLLNLDDLRWQLQDMTDDRDDVCQRYGNVTASSIAAIQRNLLALDAQGGGKLFGQPPFDIDDFIRAIGGRGVINLLHADKLMEAPKLYSGLIYWLLTELFRRLPEVGDGDKPKIVFFFDEAHLLFRDAPKHLVESLERVVRLIRSKGVGVYFVTQSPADVPDTVLAQLGNRIQHALRAYTPKEQRFVKAAARSFRPNPGVDVESLVLSMGVGDALASMLSRDGEPQPVERIRVTKPEGDLGPVSDIERKTAIEASVFFTEYPSIVDAERANIDFQDAQRAKYGLPALADDTTNRGGHGVEDALAPLYALNHAPPKRRLPGIFQGLVLMGCAWGLLWLAGLSA